MLFWTGITITSYAYLFCFYLPDWFTPENYDNEWYLFGLMFVPFPAIAGPMAILHHFFSHLVAAGLSLALIAILVSLYAWRVQSLADRQFEAARLAQWELWYPDSETSLHAE